MSRFLTDPAMASDLESVEYQRDRDRAIFSLRNCETLVFSPSPDVERSTSRDAAMIQKRGVIFWIGLSGTFSQDQLAAERTKSLHKNTPAAGGDRITP